MKKSISWYQLYKRIGKTKQAKVITTRTKDCPKDWDGSLEITFGENAD